MAFGFPFSEGLLRAGTACLSLDARHHLLEVTAGGSDAALLLARQLGCRATILSTHPVPSRDDRLGARAEGLEARIEHRALPEGPWTLPFRSYDAALVLGGALTALGRTATLERLTLHLVPRGGLLLADLVYQGAHAPAAVNTLLESIRGVDGEDLVPVEHGPAPVVRAILEQGRFTYLTEPAYREMLEALGFEIEFTALLPESAWASYFEAGAGAPDETARALLAQEASAYYTYGGRGTVAYLFAVARLAPREEWSEGTDGAQ